MSAAQALRIGRFRNRNRRKYIPVFTLKSERIFIYFPSRFPDLKMRARKLIYRSIPVSDRVYLIRTATERFGSVPPGSQPRQPNQPSHWCRTRVKERSQLQLIGRRLSDYKKTGQNVFKVRKNCLKSNQRAKKKRDISPEKEVTTTATGRS